VFPFELEPTDSRGSRRLHRIESSRWGKPDVAHHAFSREWGKHLQRSRWNPHIRSGRAAHRGTVVDDPCPSYGRRFADLSQSEVRRPFRRLRFVFDDETEWSSQS